MNSSSQQHFSDNPLMSCFFLFLRFAKDRVNFSLNSDDPLVCQTRIDLEQGVAFNEIGLSPAEITRAVRYVVHLTFSLKAIMETFSLWT